MSLFRNASYVASAHELRELPPPTSPEIVFAGRSNAGKSSAINTLAGHKRLAFVSKTPGRTQLINFFRLNGGSFLVDLPGYGYAKVPESLRKHWEGTLAAYLQTRETLCGMVLIMDARHPLTPLDRNMIDWFAASGRPVHILLTKADKLSRQEATRTLREVQKEIGLLGPQYSAQLFSSLKGTGVEEAEKVLGAWLADETNKDKDAPELLSKSGDGE